jgi:hypothetical protein
MYHLIWCYNSHMTLLQLSEKMTREQYFTFEILTSVTMKSTIVWLVTPCSMVEVHRRFGGTYRQELPSNKPAISGRQADLCLPPACCWVRIEAIHSSETSVDLYHATQCYKPEYRTLQFIVLYRRPYPTCSFTGICI